MSDMHAGRNPTALTLLALSVPCLALNSLCDRFIIGPGGQICTTVAVPSVVLTITNEAGETLPAATIAFTLNGGPPSIGGCTGTCGSVVLAFEGFGRFDIEVGAPGYVTSDLSVVVDLDEAGCHPVTEEQVVVLRRDDTVGALAGAWSTSNLYGDSILRFGDNGEIIGAILLDRTVSGDGNFYIAYNGRSIQGVPGQAIFPGSAPEPTRSGNLFDFRATTLSIPVGFENASLSADFNTLFGVLAGVEATYTRLAEIPQPLLAP